jgi:hypothetical protein
VKVGPDIVVVVFGSKIQLSLVEPVVGGGSVVGILVSYRPAYVDVVS